MVVLPPVYPASNNERDSWILERRPSRAKLDPSLAYAFSLEDECSPDGEVVPVATLFLTNRECPWRCLMCDLWRNTLRETVPLGAIPAQIDHALAQLGPAKQIKLYNSGSFFDRKAIPIEDYAAIAARLDSFERVIVESHPALLRNTRKTVTVSSAPPGASRSSFSMRRRASAPFALPGESCLRFRDLLKGSLEVAMGLETVHPEILPRLNKRMTVEQFSTAAEWLKTNGIDLRTFILIKPPFMNEEEALYWAQRSLDFAFDCGAAVASLIPTRAGNGAMDELAARGEFAPPRIDTLEAAAAYGLSLKKGRVFADLWDLERISTCGVCYGPRRARLNEMNLRQSLEPRVDCAVCRSK